MNTETLTLKGPSGREYTVTIAQDEHAENPFKDFEDLPLLVYSLDHRTGRLDTYNEAPDCMADFVRLLPDSLFERGTRMKLIKELNCTVKEFAEARKVWGQGPRDAFIEILTEEIGSKPEGWRDAGDWFEMAEMLLGLAGIPFHSTESHGYSQGDTVKLLALAPLEWRNRVGAPLESCERQCESACNLYGAWAWGDVYGISKIHGPGTVDEDGDESEEGEELSDASVWGFYGSDHKASGLIESAQNSIDCHEEQQAQLAAKNLEAHRRVTFLARNMALT